MVVFGYRRGCWYGMDWLRAELGDWYWGEILFDVRVVDLLLWGVSICYWVLRSMLLLLVVCILI